MPEHQIVLGTKVPQGITTLPFHHESIGVVPAPADRVFAHVDDQTRLSSHMGRPSWRMGGGWMQVTLDEGRGQRVGSHVRLSGKAFGIELAVDGVVTGRDPPRRKTWETVGTPKLLVIGAYRMGLDLEPRAEGSRLRVFIDYALPHGPVTRWLGRLFGHHYARWCAGSMVEDAVGHFATERVT